MRIQPISTNQQQTSFQAMKLPKLKVRPRFKPNLTMEQEQKRNSVQAVLVALAFCAAAFTKYFIDVCNGKHRAQSVVVAPAKQSVELADTNTYQLK